MHPAPSPVTLFGLQADFSTAENGGHAGFLEIAGAQSGAPYADLAEIASVWGIIPDAIKAAMVGMVRGVVGTMQLTWNTSAVNTETAPLQPVVRIPIDEAAIGLTVGITTPAPRGSVTADAPAVLPNAHAKKVSPRAETANKKSRQQSRR